jgi:hypothetical protein
MLPRWRVTENPHSRLCYSYYRVFSSTMAGSAVVALHHHRHARMAHHRRAKASPWPARGSIVSTFTISGAWAPAATRWWESL